MMEVAREGNRQRVRLHLHPGQARAWRSRKRFVAVIAGTQSGKTVFGPHWLRREIALCGPGDYLVATPTYPLLNLKALPEFLKLFRRTLALGTYVGSPTRCFTFSDAGCRATFGRVPDVPTQVYFGHASDPDSLESATAKAAWLDEAGQKKFKLGSWEAIQRRLSVHRGRALVTTTPYDLGWLKQKLYDPWHAARGAHPDIDVVRFDSTENPAFPKEEFERALRELPRWKFDLFYRAIFTRPAGMIYDCFEPTAHVWPASRIPSEWPRFVGCDFGPVNTAAVFLAEERAQDGTRTGRLVCYREYHPGRKLTPAEHAANLLAGEPRTPTLIGGAASEDEWRREFRGAGLPVRAPVIREVEVGIDCVYKAIREGQLVVSAACTRLLDELSTYSREVDEAGNVVEDKIEAKETYHLLDSLRYIISWLRPPRTRLNVGV
jgi:hypothetical protein